MAFKPLLYSFRGFPSITAEAVQWDGQAYDEEWLRGVVCLPNPAGGFGLRIFGRTAIRGDWLVKHDRDGSISAWSRESFAEYWKPVKFEPATVSGFVRDDPVPGSGAVTEDWSSAPEGGPPNHPEPPSRLELAMKEAARRGLRIGGGEKASRAIPPEPAKLPLAPSVTFNLSDVACAILSKQREPLSHENLETLFDHLKKLWFELQGDGTSTPIVRPIHGLSEKAQDAIPPIDFPKASAGQPVQHADISGNSLLPVLKGAIQIWGSIRNDTEGQRDCCEYRIVEWVSGQEAVKTLSKKMDIDGGWELESPRLLDCPSKESEKRTLYLFKRTFRF
jgi:hypothetical protein